MIQCPKCKHEIDDTACRPRVCEQCGADLQDLQATRSPVEQPDTGSQPDMDPNDDHRDELASDICTDLKLGINVNQFYMAGFKGVLDLKLENIGLDGFESVQVEVSSDLLTQTETWDCSLASAQTTFKKFQVRAEAAGIELIQFRILARAGQEVQAFWAETDIPVFENTQDLRNISIQADNIVGVGSVAQNAKSMGNAIRGQMDALIRMDKIKNATDLMREYRKMAPSYGTIDLQYDPERSRTASVTDAKGIGLPTPGCQTDSVSPAAGAGKRRTRLPWVALLLVGCMVVGIYWVRGGRVRGPGQAGGEMRQPDQEVAVSGTKTEETKDSSQQSVVSGQTEPVVTVQTESTGHDPEAQRPTTAETKGQDSQKPAVTDRQEDSAEATPVAPRDLIVIVNCEDTMLLGEVEGLLRAALNKTGQSVEYLGDSQRASGSELRAKHAKILAQHTCPYLIAQVQATDENRDVAGATMPFCTVSLSLKLFDPGSSDPRMQAISRKIRGSFNPAKARKDALDEAFKEVQHELD